MLGADTSCTHWCVVEDSPFSLVEIRLTLALHDLTASFPPAMTPQEIINQEFSQQTLTTLARNRQYYAPKFTVPGLGGSKVLGCSAGPLGPDCWPEALDRGL